MDCTYCGSDVTAHDPVTVLAGTEPAAAGEPAGVFCNYGCLAAWIDEGDRAVGAACEWSPD